METKIYDVMHRGVVTCEVDTPAKKVLQMMMDYNVPAIVVIDEMTEACGLVSEREIARYYPDKLEGKTAEEIMRPFKLVVLANEMVVHAVNLMLQRRIDHLIIVQGGHAGNRPVGTLSLSDVVEEMAKRLG